MIAVCLAAPVAPRTVVSRPCLRSGVAALPSRRSVLARAAAQDTAQDALKDATEAVETKLAELTEFATKKWEESDNKPGLVLVGATSLVALYFTNSLVSTIDRLPLINTTFELVGLAVSAWFAYRWITVPGEKARIISNIKAYSSKIGIDL